jgi:hypothetical protein
LRDRGKLNAEVTIFPKFQRTSAVIESMGSKRYRIYSDHKRANIIMPDTSDLDEAHQLAHSAAKLGHDALYRVFELTSDSPTGEQFVTAWSVLGGKVKQLEDARIPAGHW